MRRLSGKGSGLKKKILCSIAYYLPGYKSGGPVRTISNLVERLGDEFDFYIVTSDRDCADDRPYPGVTVNAWNRAGKALVYYMPAKGLVFSKLSRLIRKSECDIIYFNSFFNPGFTILPLLARKLGLLPDAPVILAPRGEFSKGALKIKWLKKKIFIALSRVIGLYDHINWQASSAYEKKDIQSIMGKRAENIVVAPDLTVCEDLSAPGKAGGKTGSCLKIVFLSRITPMKNLDYAVNVLAKVKTPVMFTIAGPVDDKPYWDLCRSLIRNLPGNITVNYMGSVAHEKVHDVLSENDLFFLPTRGENFGHVILESLSAGTPVLVSDQSPWRSLEQKGVGWDLPLEDEEAFVKRIEACFSTGPEAYRAWRNNVKAFAASVHADTAAMESSRQLFLSAF